MSEAATPAVPQPEPASKPAGAPKRLKELPDPWPMQSLDDIKKDDAKKEASPFSDSDPRVRFYSWLGFLVRMLAIFGAVITAAQYFTVREEKRVERTLDLVTLWEQEKYQDAQRALDERLNPLIEQARSMLGADAGEADRAVAASKIGKAVMSEKGGAMPLPEFTAQFESIVYFLNRLAFCVESNLCSRDVSDAYFRDYAVSFWTYFEGYVSDRRRLSPNYARPLEDYVKLDDAGWLALIWPATPSDPGGTTP